MKIAIIGAGWAGMAAAMAVVQAGQQANVFEAARTVGGRARTIVSKDALGAPLLLDNGQHILIGAYSECLRLMRLAGVDPDTALLRLPLALRFADNSGLQWPDLAPPWDAVLGIAGARSWSWRERLALLGIALRWRVKRFTCAPQASVAHLCAGLPARLLQEFIDPLCIAALNTPAHQASGQVFLRVLQDSLFSGPGGSNLLLPRVDLGEVFAQAAAHWLRTHGTIVHTAARVQSLTSRAQGGWVVDGRLFDAVILATCSTEAARLVSQCAQNVPSALSAPRMASARRVSRAVVSAQRRCRATRFSTSPTKSRRRLPWLPIGKPLPALRPGAWALRPTSSTSARRRRCSGRRSLRPCNCRCKRQSRRLKLLNNSQIGL